MEGVSKKQLDSFSLGLHGFPVQFNTPNGGNIGTAPVEIQAAIVIQEQIRIPKIKSPGDFLIRAVDGVLGTVKIADLPPLRSGKIQPFTNCPDVGGVVVNGQVGRQQTTFPMGQVFRHPDRAVHGSKKIIFPLKKHQGWIGSFTIYQFGIVRRAAVRQKLIVVGNI